MLGKTVSFLTHFANWWREESLDADALRKLQEKKLGRQLKAAMRTKFYGDKLKGVTPADFFESPESIPLTGKPDIRDHPEAFVPDYFAVKALGFAQTSGSSGTPTRIYQDIDTACLRQAVRYATDISYGRAPFQLYCRLHSVDFDRNLDRMLPLFPKMFLPVYDPPEKNFAMLMKHRPKTIRGYPSALSLIAKMNSRVPNPLRLKNIVCVGELLSEDVRKELSDSFSCPVYTHYGSMECSSIARECVKGRSLHVESKSCIVEIVDEKGRPKKSGQGELVVSPLFNRAMPLFRFRIGDEASWGRECDCGKETPVITDLTGRKDDQIILPGGRTVPGKSFYVKYALLSHFYEYQIEQAERGLFIFRYVPVASDIPDAAKVEIAQGIRRQCFGESVRVEFERTSGIKKGRTGKLRVVFSKVGS